MNKDKPVQLPQRSLVCPHQQAYSPFLPCLVGEVDLSFETVDSRQLVAAVAADADVREQVSSTTQKICIRLRWQKGD
jgi:hypothetical protein